MKSISFGMLLLLGVQGLGSLICLTTGAAEDPTIHQNVYVIDQFYSKEKNPERREAYFDIKQHFVSNFPHTINSSEEYFIKNIQVELDPSEPTSVILKFNDEIMGSPQAINRSNYQSKIDVYNYSPDDNLDKMMLLNNENNISIEFSNSFSPKKLIVTLDAKNKVDSRKKVNSRINNTTNTNMALTNRDLKKYPRQKQKNQEILGLFESLRKSEESEEKNVRVDESVPFTPEPPSARKSTIDPSQILDLRWSSSEVHLGMDELSTEGPVWVSFIPNSDSVTVGSVVNLTQLQGVMEVFKLEIELKDKSLIPFEVSNQKGQGKGILLNPGSVYSFPLNQHSHIPIASVRILVQKRSQENSMYQVGVIP